MSKANGGNDTAIASLSLCLQCYTDKATDPTIKEPLYGFLPRKVKGEQVRRVLVSFFSPFYNCSAVSLKVVHRKVMSTRSRNNRTLRHTRKL